MSREKAFESAPDWIKHSAEVVAGTQINVTIGSARWRRVRDAAALELVKAFERGRSDGVV